jgi:hypothetical protein
MTQLLPIQKNLVVGILKETETLQVVKAMFGFTLMILKVVEEVETNLDD